MENRNPYASPGDVVESHRQHRESEQWTLLGSAIPLCWYATYGWLKIVLAFVEEPSAIRPAAWGAMETWIFVPWFPSLLLFSAAVSCVFLVRWSNAFPKWLVAVMSLLPIVTSIVITTSAFFGLKQV